MTPNGPVALSRKMTYPSAAPTEFQVRVTGLPPVGLPGATAWLVCDTAPVEFLNDTISYRVIDTPMPPAAWKLDGAEMVALGCPAVAVTLAGASTPAEITNSPIVQLSSA